MSHKACQLDQDGFFLEEVECQPSPLEPGQYLIPGGCVDHAPPVEEKGKRAQWNAKWKKWVHVPIETASTVKAEAFVPAGETCEKPLSKNK